MITLSHRKRVREIVFDTASACGVCGFCSIELATLENGQDRRLGYRTGFPIELFTAAVMCVLAAWSTQNQREAHLLEDMTPVVRGGANRNADLLLNQVLNNLDRGSAALSVFWSLPLDGESEVEYLVRICVGSRIPHKQIQLSTPNQILTAGFGFAPDCSEDQPRNHYHVLFEEPVTLTRAELFISIFSEPRPNPTGGYRMRS